MDALFQLPQPWLAVIDATAKATAVLAAAALAARALRRSSAATRHLVWTCALVAALVLPAVSLVLPRWEAPLLRVARPAAAASAQPPAAAVQAPALGIPHEARTAGTAPDAAPGMSPTVPRDAGGARPRLSWTALAAIAWAAGTVLILGRLLLGFVFVQRLSRRSTPVTDAPWLPLAREIAADLGVARVTFRRAAGPVMPMAWGIVRPVVLMPEEADTWTAQRLRIVLLHELAHVKRADCLTHLLAQAACAVYWINPLAWMAVRRARAERERACDDLVLSRGTRGSDYADQLLEIARAMGAGPSRGVIASASLAMANRSQLEGRLMSILDPTVPRTGVSRVRAAGVTAAALALVVPFATMQTWAFEEDRAMVPRASAQAQPRPEPRPMPAPATETMTRRAFEVRGGAPSQDVVQGAVQGAIQGATQDVTQGMLQGIAQGVVQGLAQGVAQGIREGVGQGAGQGAGQGTGRGAGRAAGQRSADPKLIAALTEALNDTDKQVREAAMLALVQMRAPGVVDPLLRALKDASEDVREQAAFGLGQIGDKRAVAPLTAALRDASAGVREQAAFALGQLDDPSATSALIEALKDESASVREQAVFALGQLEAREAVDALLAALKDSSGSVKEQAAFALGQIGDSRATDALIALLKDPSPQVRQQAAFALSQIR